MCGNPGTEDLGEETPARVDSWGGDHGSTEEHPMSGLTWRGILIVATVSTPAFAQFGGGGFGPGPAPREVRDVKVETAEGKSVSGPLSLAPIQIVTDFGLYAVRPDRVKEIRLEPNEAPIASPQGAQVSATLVTTTDEELKGMLRFPPDWVIETDLGTLTLAPGGIKLIRFAPVPATTTIPPVRATPVRPTGAEVPRTARFGKLHWVASSTGHRIVVQDTASGKTGTLDLPATEKEPLEVVPVIANDVLALWLKGKKLTRIAVYDTADGVWHPQELREPASNQASPIVGNGLAVYGLGRFVYAFSAQANAWDILELPAEGPPPSPVVSGDDITVERDGHIHTFGRASGKWVHTDAAKLLAQPPSP